MEGEEGRGKDKGKGSGFLWDNSKRIVYKFFMGC